MADLKLTYAWSDSRMKTFRDCARRYFYNYYLSWEGWMRNAPERKQMAYLLKHLTSRHMWPGSIVHEIIEHVIKTYKLTGKWIYLQDAQKMGIDKLRAGWLSSTKQEWKNTPKSVNLFEHYYKGGINKEQTDQCKRIVLESLKGFYASKMAKIIASLHPEDWVALEDFQKFSLNDGSEVSVKIDCGFRHDGKIYLLDWKTGKINNAVIDQLITYAMYALKNFARKLSDIIIVPVYLMHTGELAEQLLTVTKEQLLSHASVIKNESAILKVAHSKKDDEEWFGLTENTNSCKYCSFRKICPGADR